jgi:hypothetical protein
METDVFRFHCSDPIVGNFVWSDILASLLWNPNIYDPIIQIKTCLVAASLLDK